MLDYAEVLDTPLFVTQEVRWLEDGEERLRSSCVVLTFRYGVNLKAGLR